MLAFVVDMWDSRSGSLQCSHVLTRDLQGPAHLGKRSYMYMHA